MEKKMFIHAPDADSSTLSQFKHCAEQEFVIASALMPDAHSGYVAPIGSVLVTKDYLVPSWVGFDIGCGVIAVKLSSKELIQKVKTNLDKVYAEVIKTVPMGLGETRVSSSLSKESEKKFNELLIEFQNKPHNKEILNLIKTMGPLHLGTLGGGNHFIELSNSENEVWIIVHSGSRGLGHKIAEHYMKKASNSKAEFEKTFAIKDDSPLGKEYLNVLDFCLEFALLNRLEISNKVKLAIEKVLGEKIESELWVNKNHNHALKEKSGYVHRKGATPAKKGERGVIPANMRDGVYLVEGKGSSNFLNSSSHGAGRILSRTDAKKKITLDEFQKSMQGIKGTISNKTLDEAPQAYKNIHSVMELQKQSIKVIKHLTPLINWKG